MGILIIEVSSHLRPATRSAPWPLTTAKAATWLRRMQSGRTNGFSVILLQYAAMDSSGKVFWMTGATRPKRNSAMLLMAFSSFSVCSIKYHLRNLRLLLPDGMVYAGIMRTATVPNGLDEMPPPACGFSAEKRNQIPYGNSRHLLQKTTG